MLRQESTDYTGQQDGVNEHNCPYIKGQNVTNTVQDLEAWMAQLGAQFGFSSVEEMIAVAERLPKNL